MDITTYIIKFDADGNRIATLPVDSTLTDERKSELLADGYIEVSAEDWEQYCAGKIRGADGKPTDAPAYVPSKEEKLAQLDSQYDADKDALAKYYLDAVLSSNTDLQEELKAELDALNTQYEAARKEIEEG